MLAADFARYAALPPARREALVSEAAAVVARALDGWAMLAPRPQPPAGPIGLRDAPAARVLDTGGQRTQTWYQKRDGLLTASTFGNILGFWGEDRLQELWVRPSRCLALFGCIVLCACITLGFVDAEARFAARRRSVWVCARASRATS